MKHISFQCLAWKFCNLNIFGGPNHAVLENIILMKSPENVTCSTRKHYLNEITRKRNIQSLCNELISLQILGTLESKYIKPHNMF